MRRREFLGVLGGTVAWPLTGYAQRRPLVGYLAIQSASTSGFVMAAFRQGLSEGGFIEGRDVDLLYRYADGQPDKLPALARDLVVHQVSAIAAMGGSRSALAAKSVTTTVPIVFTIGDADPVQAGVVSSLARPGGNATGISLLGGMLGAKRLELLRELVPGAKTIGVLINPETRNAAAELREIEGAIAASGQTAVIVKSGPSENLEIAFASFHQQRTEALVVTADPTFTNRRAQIIALAARQELPTIYQWSVFVSDGGLIGYGAELEDVYRQAGRYTARVLKGEKTTDLPVQQPTKFHLAINLKTAKALGLTVPPTMLARADEVIE